MSQIIDASTRALAQQAATTNKTIAQLVATIDGQVVEIQTNANTIADQENMIAANEKRIESEVRNAAAEIRLQVKEDRKAVLSTLLGEEGLVATTQAEIDETNQQIQDLEAKAARTEFDAVRVAESKLHAQYKGQISNLEADHKVAIATYTANAQRDAEIIDSLRKQVAGLEKTIEANREAETARTTAMAQPAVTINQGK
jgi:polyhydroxyalkanoate synthesis regulator phasin